LVDIPPHGTLRRMGIYGYLDLGTALSSDGVMTPSAAAGYARQFISFEDTLGGVALNDVSCVFGPLTAPWGEITSFGVADENDNPMFLGTLRVSFTPRVGALVVAQPGDISIVLFPQFVDNGGVLTAGIDIFPKSDFELSPGDVWSNEGVINVVPGFEPAIIPSVFVFGLITAAQLLEAGAAGITTSKPTVGSNLLYLVGDEIWIADSASGNTGLANSNGVLIATTNIFPTDDASLPAGSIWSNGGVLNVVLGFMPGTPATLTFGQVTAAQLLAIGAFNITTVPPTPGSGQLYLVGAEIWVA
jgi:hypothetical protein